MRQSDRPLSPHLSIYRWPVTMLLSILHRASGIANAAGLIVFAAWLMQASAGETAYGALTALLGSPPGYLLLVGFSFAFFYHLCNGIRHLIWDTGRGLEKRQARISAWVVIALSLISTASFWGLAL